MVVDLSDPDSGHFAMDVETDQSHLWSSPTHKGNGFEKIWEEDDYFRCPTIEVA